MTLRVGKLRFFDFLYAKATAMESCPPPKSDLVPPLDRLALDYALNILVDQAVPVVVLSVTVDVINFEQGEQEEVVDYEIINITVIKVEVEIIDVVLEPIFS